ncbi:hypothetical protein BDZ91DRAFT_846729 [Kalaharituber pfeilii]|nr:hypothetical protein BDZ91DRAFT_846729 [Kalaharituber pfeilii]
MARLCTLPNFNECTVRGETGCCEVVRTATACPPSYTLCEHEGDKVHEEALYLQEVGYRFGCCPIGFSCLPRPSCVGYVEVQPSISVSTFLTVIVVTITQAGTTQTVVLSDTVTIGNQTSADEERSSPAGPVSTETLTMATEPHVTSTEPYSSSLITVIATRTLHSGSVFPTYLPKLNLGQPVQANENNRQGGGGSGLQTGAVAAIVVTSSLIGVFLVAISIRIWRKRKQRMTVLSSRLQDNDRIGPLELASNGPDSGPLVTGYNVAELEVDDLLISNPVRQVAVYKAELSAAPVPMELAADGVRTGSMCPEMLQVRTSEAITQQSILLLYIRGDWDTAVLWVKGHKGIPGNEAADEAARVSTALQIEPEMITEAGLRQGGRRERAVERSRLGLSYKPLERLGHMTGRLAGLLWGKGLRAWRWHIGEEDGPECRWCGEKEETIRHVLDECRVWRRRWPGGEEHVREPPRGEGGKEDPLKKLVEMLGE